LDVSALVRLLDGLEVDIANLNAPDQVVLSGLNGDLDAACERLRADPELGRARAIPLEVSAPFHSRFMRPAASGFAPLVATAAETWTCSAAACVASNRTGGFHEPVRERIVQALVEQISAPVRWLDNMRALVERAARIVEVGPSRPLRALFARVGAQVDPITDLTSAAKWGQVKFLPTRPA
jgi:[acyl-carrier-protein] S-malonyltransferase/trans-AT polyketide synthase/acyltransferase/oxidoreductase domain-containing protein